MNLKYLLSRMTLWGLAITSLGVVPLVLYDPFNVPRFTLIFVFGAVGFFLFLTVGKELLRSRYRYVFFVVFGFVLWSLIALLVSKLNFTEGLFGVAGRHTGFLAYSGLAILLLCALISSSVSFLRKLSNLLVSVSLIAGFYGLLQSLGADPIDWINPFNQVIGLFGNPNFQSSFMGIAAVAAIAMSLEGAAKLQNRIGLLIIVALALFNIYESKSQQGYLVFISGVLVVGYLFVRGNDKFKKLTFLYVVASLIGFVAVVLDILQKSPWSSILYKESVAFRGDFWRAGWKMTTDNPIFGVGLDGYRDHYKASRDLVAALRPGSDAMTDSAHNVFLDISSGGGFPLLIIYVFLIGLTIFSAIKVIRRSRKFDVIFASVLGAWVAYLAQSVISINQLGLAAWGWVLMGAIIGYEFNTREKDEAIRIKPFLSRLSISLGLIIGLGAGIPLIAADATFRSSLQSGEALKIEASVRQWPQSVTRMILVAQILRENNLPERSIVIAREAVTFNPMNFEAWKELSLQPNATEQERGEALATMKKLDPYNPKLK
jgi:O-antigen ligase